MVKKSSPELLKSQDAGDLGDFLQEKESVRTIPTNKSNRIINVFILKRIIN
jgi:hypothetical protein